MQFLWGEEQEAAFTKVKALIQSARVLAHFDPNQEMVVISHASPKGVGLMLYHIMSVWSEHPVVTASRSLSPAQKNYSQIDKEALALISAVKSSINTFMDRTYETDHKPLLGLFDENKSLPETASPGILT